MSPDAALLTGRVSHSRLGPRPHAFAYRLFMLRLDLDRVARLDQSHRLVGLTRRRLVRFEPGDFMGVSRHLLPLERLAALRRAVVDALVAHGAHTPVARVVVIAHARIAGYQFNPVSFFCAYSEAGDLVGVVADVHNTFGERHAYVLAADATTATGQWSEKKVFHVSPFFTLDGSYRFTLRLADDGVDIRIDLLDDGVPVFVSRLALQASPLTDRALLAALCRFQSMTVRVIGAIHWEALRLWRRGLPYLTKPAYDPGHARTTTRS